MNSGCFGVNSVLPFGHKNNSVDEYAIYEERKKNIKLPKNMEKFFRLLQDISKNGYSKALMKRNAQQIQNQPNNFFKTFDRLSKQQKNHYLLQLIIEADRRIFDRAEIHYEKTLTLETFSHNQTLKDTQKYLQSKCRYCSSAQKTLGLIKNWHQTTVKLNKLKKRLTIKQKNSLFHLPLRSYILRAKSDELTFVLESTHQFQERNLKKVLFEFKNKESYSQMSRNITDIIVAYQIDKLMMENVFNEKFDKIDDSKRNKVLLHLTPSTIKNCSNKIQTYEKSSQKQRTYERIIFKEDFQSNESIVIKQFKNSEGYWYESQILIHDRHDPKTINFLQIYQHSHKYLAKFNILQTYAEENLSPSEQKIITEEDKKFCAFYQKLKICERIYGQEIFLQKVKRKEENENVYYFVNLDHDFNENFIHFLKVTLSPSAKPKNSEDFFVMKITVKFNSALFSQDISGEIFQQFIKEFYAMFERLRFSQSPEDQEITIKEINSKFFIEKDLISRFGDQESPMDFLKKNASPSSINVFIKRLSVIDIPTNAFLRRRHKMNPTTQKIGKLMKEHFLYKQWQRLPKGGLKCTNYELVAFQKSLYKAVIKKFGENLLKGRNIINFSLPVVCFKKESHLQSIAQSVCYNPIYLQKAAKIKQPVQRMKYSVVIMIAVGILTVQSEKPFNPILGETYQGYCDGCPVYMEQISHHPPVSAYYMVGRGYKVYGCVQPRISLLFNGATGYSILPQYIQFDDGTVIEVIYAKITITGMMFGDREFYFEDKIYAFDKKNNLFTQLIFGPFNKGGIFSSSSQPADYFHGKIYQVTDDFKNEFNKSMPRIYPQKKDIVKEHMMFDGIWSGSVHIDGEEIINFKTDLPYEFVQEEYPIPSDSRYRQDLQKLVEGDKEGAQRVKQEMQEAQRKDRKLRAKEIIP